MILSPHCSNKKNIEFFYIRGNKIRIINSLVDRNLVWINNAAFFTHTQMNSHILHLLHQEGNKQKSLFNCLNLTEERSVILD